METVILMKSWVLSLARQQNKIADVLKPVLTDD